VKLEVKIVSFLLLAIAALHSYTLDLFPLPWFDELHFSGIAKSLAEQGNLKSYFLTSTKGEMNSVAYGPVFFTLNAFFIDLFGFSLYSVRLSTLFFGLFNILLIYLLSLHFRINRITRIAVIICFGLDAVYSTTLHEARMETLVVFFLLLSLCVFYISKWTDYRKVVVIAVLCVLCFLTSPRSFFLLTPLSVLLFVELQTNKLKFTFVFASIFLLIYSVWVLFIHHDYLTWLHYYQGLMKGNTTAHAGYLGGNFYVSKAQYALISITSLLVLLTIKHSFKFKSIVWFLYACLLLFYLIIYDWGVYSTLVIPFFYLLLLFLLHQFSKQKPWFNLVLLPLFLFNLLFFTLKLGTVILEKNNRSTALVASKLKTIVPAGE
jgi:4-amino-4-deoxy-L-arabinose transferase-like glycosyltransferase